MSWFREVLGKRPTWKDLREQSLREEKKKTGMAKPKETKPQMKVDSLFRGKWVRRRVFTKTGERLTRDFRAEAEKKILRKGSFPREGKREDLQSRLEVETRKMSKKHPHPGVWDRKRSLQDRGPARPPHRAPRHSLNRMWTPHQRDLHWNPSHFLCSGSTNGVAHRSTLLGSLQPLPSRSGILSSVLPVASLLWVPGHQT